MKELFARANMAAFLSNRDLHVDLAQQRWTQP